MFLSIIPDEIICFSLTTNWNVEVKFNFKDKIQEKIDILKYVWLYFNFIEKFPKENY